MRGLAVCRLGDLDAPLHRSLFQRGPVEGAVEAALELPAQRLRVVVVDELHAAAGWQGLEGGEHQSVAFAGRDGPKIHGGRGVEVVVMSESCGG